MTDTRRPARRLRDLTLYTTTMTGGRDDRLVSCDPCSPENLHLMAQEMGIRRCWYHGDHYALPKTFDLMRFALNVQVVTHVDSARFTEIRRSNPSRRGTGPAASFVDVSERLQGLLHAARPVFSGSPGTRRSAQRRSAAPPGHATPPEGVLVRVPMVDVINPNSGRVVSVHVDWYWVQGRKRTVPVRSNGRETFKTIKFPSMAFAIARSMRDGRVMSLHEAVCHEAPTGPDSYLSSNVAFVCLGTEAAALVRRGEMDAITAYFMSRFRGPNPLDGRMVMGLDDRLSIAQASLPCAYGHLRLSI